MKSLKAGAGKSDITPEVGVELAGYGPFLERKSTGVHDPLFCKALIFESEEDRGVFLICDLTCIKDSLVKEVRKAISTRFPIKPEKILIAATHTHSGPSTGGHIGWGEEDEKYVSSLPELILPAVEEAFKNSKEINIGIGHFPIRGEEISCNRVQKELGVNREIGLIKLIEKETGSPLALLVNYGVHGVVQGPANTLISRDWPGEAVDLIQEKLQAETIFLQGACGDINSNPAVCKDPEEGFREIERIGEFFAKVAIQGFKNLEVKEGEKLSFNQFFVNLPCEPIPEEELKKTIKENEEILEKKGIEEKQKRFAKFHIARAKAQLSLYEKGEVNFKKIEVQVIELDNALIIAVPVELFSEFAHNLGKSLPERGVFVVTHANGSTPYAPSTYDFENKLYASTFAPHIWGSMPFRKDVGEILTKEILKEVN